MRTLRHSSAGAAILVVNGDDTTGNLLQDVLAKEGYDVHHAGSAQEMWQVLDQRSVDLILLRLHLTDAFGLDLIPRLAEHPQKPTVIILSGPRDLETAIECMRLGAYDYLTKPVAPGPFLIAVERALTARHIYQENVKCQSDLARNYRRLRLLLELAVKLRTAFLRTQDLDRILQAVLVGVTAGEGLGFNRAFLVSLNTQDQYLEGMLAIGPASREEAHRIWAEIAERSLGLFEILDGVQTAVSNQGHPLNRIVRNIRVPMEDTKHVLVRAIRERKAFLVGDGAPPGLAVPSDLVSLLGTDHLAVVPLASDETAYGVILADNAITKDPIMQEDVEALQLFAGLASIAVDKARICAMLGAQIHELHRFNEAVEQNKDILIQAERYRALGQMADQLLHEIRNPLSAVGGIARRLHSKSKDGETQQYAEVILRETHRLEHILKGLSDFTSAPQLDLKPVQLYELIEASIAVLQSELVRHHIGWQTHLPEPKPVLNLDRNQIQQALLNILKNAVEAMPEGGLLTVEVQHRDHNVEILVTDTGRGIISTNLTKALEPFFTTKTRSMGLGLTLAKRVLELHGGSVSLKGTKAGGTAVALTLPGLAASADTSFLEKPPVPPDKPVI